MEIRDVIILIIVIAIIIILVFLLISKNQKMPYEFTVPNRSCKGKSWYVKYDEDGDGSKESPFGNMKSAENASSPGDTIYVLPHSKSLETGIKLKSNQCLIGLGMDVRDVKGNEAAARISSKYSITIIHNENTTVRNIFIEDPSPDFSTIRTDVSGSVTQKVVIRRNSLPFVIARHPDKDCAAIIDGDEYTQDSVFAGCNSLPAQSRFVAMFDIFGENQLETQHFEHWIEDCVFETDLDSGTNRVSITGQFAGKAHGKINIRNVASNGSFKTLYIVAYQDVRVETNVDGLISKNVINDHVEVETDFSCAGDGINRINPETDFFCNVLLPNELDDVPPPVSNANVKLNISGLVTDDDRGVWTGQASRGIVVFSNSDQSTTDIEVHVRNSKIQNCRNSGFMFFNGDGEFRNAIFDFGCVNVNQGNGETHKTFGLWNSPGNNIFSNNGYVNSNVIGNIGSNDFAYYDWSGEGRIPIFAQGNFYSENPNLNGYKVVETLTSYDDEVPLRFGDFEANAIIYTDVQKPNLPLIDRSHQLSKPPKY